MKDFYLKFSLSLSIAGNFFSFTSAQILQPSKGNDSVTITGKFISPCFAPEKIKIWRYNVWDAFVTGVEVPVSNGQFSYSAAINGAQQFTIKVNNKNQMD